VKILAEERARRATQYAWDMRNLPLALESGSILEARGMLTRQDEEFRAFEWHYWNRQLHAEKASFALTPADTAPDFQWFGGPGFAYGPGTGFGLPTAFFFNGDGTRLFHYSDSSDLKAKQRPLSVWDSATGKLLFTRPIEPDRIEGDGIRSISPVG